MTNTQVNWCVAGVVALCVAIGCFFVYDGCAGSPVWEQGIAGQFVHHNEWTEHHAAHTSTSTHRDSKGNTHTHLEYHPSRTIHHPAYDETPVDYPSGQWMLMGVIPKGTRYTVQLKVGKVTGWKYKADIQEAR